MENNIKNYSHNISYVEQEPYIFSGSVRENIFFGSEYDENLYNEVVEKC